MLLRRRLFFMCMSCGIFAFVMLLVMLSSTDSDGAHYKHIPHQNKRDEEPYKKDVRLSFGSTFFRKRLDNNVLSKCSVKDHCKVVSDTDSADAVIYHSADTSTIDVLKGNQVAVVWSLESPISFPFSQSFNRANWTMTYRTESDIWLPYGYAEKRKHPVQFDYEALWNNKKFMAVWLISNCALASGRLNLAAHLRDSGLDVHVYGQCGDRKTPNNCEGVSKQSDKCVSELFMSYRFSIAFENALCKDYVTEKFWNALEQRYTVPIVMQRATYESVGAPPHSFIAVDDYKNAADLVKDLERISNDKESYLKYHEWRERYKVHSDYFNLDHTGFCALCKKLMRQDFSTKHIGEVNAWQSDGACEQPQDGFVNGFIAKSKTSEHLTEQSARLSN